MPAEYSPGWGVPLVLAVVVLAAAAGVLAVIPAPDPDTEEEVATVLNLRLPLPQEKPLPMIIVEAEPEEAPPPEPEPAARTQQATKPKLTAEQVDELAEERERLKEELERARREVAGLPPPQAPPDAPPPPHASPPRRGDIGTVRELDLGGQPDNVVQDIMTRYRLKVTIKQVPGGSNQSFLSSAAAPTGERFYADRRSPPGIYQVFELSKFAVAHMSRLEEAEIVRRGGNPETAVVRRVKFGIVDGGGGYDLGVKEIEIEPAAM